jgi:hypothetical protein
LLGVSGAVAMAKWQPFRPYILGLAVIMLLWAFWRVYGPPRKKLCDAGLCAARPSLWLQGSLWIAAILIGLAFLADQLQWLFVDPTPEGLRK